MVYKTNREKVTKWIEQGLIPRLVEKEYEYQDIISGIAGEVGVTENIVEDVVKTLARAKKLKIEHRIVATDEQLIEHMKKQQELKAEADKMIDPIVENKEGEDGK